jgi:hypothetical protein
VKFATILFALVLLAVLTPRADAAPLIIGWGEKVSEVADPPKELAVAGTPDLKIGYYYNSLRLFWIPVITWSGKYVLYSDQQHKYWDLSELSETEKKSVGDLTWKGGIGALWAKYVDYILALIVGLVIVSKIFRKKTV